MKRKKSSSISTNSRSKSRSKSSSRSRSNSSKLRSSPYYISTDNLEGIYAELEDRDYEICGFLKSNRENKYLELDEQENISTDFTRKSCQTKKYKMIYHTHPLSSKSYPSSEDIFKIVKLKNKIIKISVIFTRWGIWELYCNKKSDIITDKIKHNVKQQLTSIYHQQNGAREELRSKSLLNKAINNINMILSEYDFKMYFSEWNFENDYKLHN
jgi:hypothetical protein